MGGTKKRAGFFVIDINGNTCCIIRSLPYDKVVSKLKNKIHSSINENKYVNNINESSIVLNKFNTKNNNIITNNDFNVTTNSDDSGYENKNDNVQKSCFNVTNNSNNNDKNKNVNKTVDIQTVSGDLNVSNSNNSLYDDDEEETKTLNYSKTGDLDIDEKLLDFSENNINTSKVVINDRLILFDLKNDCFLNRISNVNGKNNIIENYFNNYIFLEMFQIPRGSKEKYDADLLYTAVREFYEETLCVNNSFEIYKEPFKLYWEDGGKRWTYHIFIAFLKNEPLCFSFQPKHIRNLNMYFFENTNNGDVDVDNNVYNKDANNYQSSAIDTSEMYRKYKDNYFSNLNHGNNNSSYNIYTTKLSKSSTGSLNSIVLINVKDYINYMNVYQLKHYGNNNYNSFFDVINEYSNKNSINTNNYIKKYFNMKFNVYENIKNNKECYVRQFDKYVYLKHDKSHEIKNKWLRWWKDQLLYSKYPFTLLPTSPLLRFPSNFQIKNENNFNYFNTKVTKDSVNNNAKDDNTKYYVTKWNNLKYVNEESIIINTFDFILSKSSVTDLKNKHNNNSLYTNKICNDYCCKNIFDNAYDGRNKNYYYSHSNNNNNSFNINQINNKRKYLNIGNINTNAKINNSIYYKPNNKLKRLYDNRFYLKSSNKLINTTTTTAQLEIENIINETL